MYIMGYALRSACPSRFTIRRSALAMTNRDCPSAPGMSEFNR